MITSRNCLSILSNSWKNLAWTLQRNFIKPHLSGKCWIQRNRWKRFVVQCLLRCIHSLFPLFRTSPTTKRQLIDRMSFWILQKRGFRKLWSATRISHADLRLRNKFYCHHAVVFPPEFTGFNPCNIFYLTFHSKYLNFRRMWQEARRQEKLTRARMVDGAKRAERRRKYYESIVSLNYEAHYFGLSEKRPRAVYADPWPEATDPRRCRNCESCRIFKHNAQMAEWPQDSYRSLWCSFSLGFHPNYTHHKAETDSIWGIGRNSVWLRTLQNFDPKRISKTRRIRLSEADIRQRVLEYSHTV